MENNPILHNLLKMTQKNLNKDVISYLKSRNITKQTALKWGIGYLPSERELINLDGDKELLYKCGLLIPNINKTPLRQYITFPMYNQYSEIIGFSGRPPLSNDKVKEKGLKKYWHSIFDKRNFLYGLNFAIPSARELGYIIVTEGQFDAIIPSQAGITNIVSTCGTALTENQIILLSRYVNKVYIVFDNDEAGIRGFDQLQKHQREGIDLIPVFLPDSDGEKSDPDSFVRKYGKDKFLEILEKQ